MSEAIQAMMEFDSEVATKAAGDKAGAAYEFG
jgi:hypothetical protein